MKYYNDKFGKSQIEAVLNSDVGKEFLEDVKEKESGNMTIRCLSR